MKRRVVLRLTRFALLLFMVGTAAWFIRTYEWFGIPEADSSLEPQYRRGSRVLVKMLGADAPLARDDFVVYAMEMDGVEYARFGRVRALPGDTVGSMAGRLAVNGAPIGPIPVPGEAMGAVPPGHLLVLANAPAHEHYVDSRAFGFLPRERVQGIIVFSLGD